MSRYSCTEYLTVQSCVSLNRHAPTAAVSAPNTARQRGVEADHALALQAFEKTFLGGLREEPILVRPLLDPVALDPFRQFIVAHEPDAGKAADVFQDAIDLRRHQGTAAEMAMHRDVEERHRFVGVEIVERVLVDVVPIAWIPAQ